MASISYNSYTGNGVKKDYEFTQDMNDQATVYGLVNQVETAGTWDSVTGFFTFTTAPADGASIIIARRTSNDTAVATYPNKSYISSDNLDADFEQSLHQVQELQFDTAQAVLINAGAPGYAAAAAASAAEAAADVVLTNADVVSTNADVVLTNADVVTTGLDVTYAEEWATKAEDSLISVAAGGDGVTDYSALHWAAKAAAIATDYVAKAGDTMDSAANLTFAGGGEVLGLPATPSATGAASKEYADTKIEDAAGTVATSNLAADAVDGTKIADDSVDSEHLVAASIDNEHIAASAIDYTQLADALKTTLFRRNVMINGNFDVWQRGTNFAAAASNLYSADRWKYQKSGAVVHTVKQNASPPTYADSGLTSSYALQADVTTADASIAATDFALFSYTVEGYDYARLAGGNATLSFWVYGAKTGTHCVAFRNDGIDRTYVAEYTITSASTWEKKTITVPLTETGGTWDYTNGRGLDIVFTMACGTTFHTTADAWQTGNYLGTSSQVNELDNTANNFLIAQVQFEKGDLATPFEYRSIAEELTLCQRYYERVNAEVAYARFASGFNATATQFQGIFQWSTEKRAVPTVTSASSTLFDVYDGGVRTVSGLTFAASSTLQSVGVYCTISTATANSGSFLRAGNNTTAYIEVDAEL